MFTYHLNYVVLPTKCKPENVHFISSLLVIPLKNRDQYLLTHRVPQKPLNNGSYIVPKTILRLQIKVPWTLGRMMLENFYPMPTLVVIYFTNS
jgi:hypothetical protein